MSYLDLGFQSARELSELSTLANVRDLEEFSFTIDVSGNQLESLSCHPGTLSKALDDIFSQCEVLVAEGNRVVDLVGVDELFPYLVVLDMTRNKLAALDHDSQSSLGRLAQLDTLILCNNQIERLDMRPSVRSGPSGALWQQLVVLELSSNRLSEIPDLSMCKSITTLSLANNRIGALSSQFAHKLPHTVQRLYLDHNQIDDWWNLVQLTALSDTITDITVNHNAFTERVRFSWRIYLAWLLPGVETVDGQVLTIHEWDAVADLFRDSNSSDLSVNLLSLMNPGNEVKLEQYLNDDARVGVRSHHPHKQAVSSNLTRTGASPAAAATNTSLRSSSANPDSNWRSLSASSASPQSTRSPPVRPISSVGSVAHRSPSREPTTNTTSVPPSSTFAPHVASSVDTSASLTTRREIASLRHDVDSHTDAMKKMVERIQLIQDVVKVLRTQDVMRRVAATVVIQKHYRRYLVRRRLSKAQRDRLDDLKKHRIRAQNRGPGSPSKVPALASSMVSLLVNRRPPSDGDPSTRLGVLEAELDELRIHVVPVFRAIQSRAARTIQRHYRGHLARNQYKETLAAYKAFTQQFHGPASKIQATVRMFQQRRRYLRDVTKERELRHMRQTVKVLSGKVQGLERALETVLSRLSSVEQLTLLQGGEGSISHDSPRRAASTDKREKKPKKDKRDKHGNGWVPYDENPTY